MREVLARSPQEDVSLVRLLADEEERDRLLDHEALYEAVISHTGCLRVTPALYFYVVTRRVLTQAGLRERALSDYVAAVLEAFCQTRQLAAPGQARPGRGNYLYVSEMLERLQHAAPRQRFQLRLHLGNYTLFFCGLFAERVRSQAQRRGAPGLSFYEGVGRASYHSASLDPFARGSELAGVVEHVAREFLLIRRALNHLADSLLHWEAPPAILIREPQP
ncbi:MAG: hypothetical protein AAGK14_03985 [Verrucomicrobiota bacterium]